jgi:hypothetical protein
MAVMLTYPISNEDGIKAFQKNRPVKIREII